MDHRHKRPFRKRLKRRLKQAGSALGEMLNRFAHSRRLRPPRSLVKVHPASFDRMGRQFRDYFIEYAHLQPDQRVLDVGCSAGRMAIPLTEYLNPEGGYWGFDIRPEAIEWCQKHISARHPQFHFLHADIYNQQYNPRGGVKAKDYRFPFEDATFDLVFLVTVFSHLLPADMENYLRESARVLKPGGTCLASYFLYDPQAGARLQTERPRLVFQHAGENYQCANPENPEAAIAFEEDYIQGLHTANGLEIRQVLRGGTWSEDRNFFTAQDIVIARKAAPGTGEG